MLLMHGLDDARIEKGKGLPDGLVGLKGRGWFAAEGGDEFGHHCFPEGVVVVAVAIGIGHGGIISLHVFVHAEDGGRDDGCVMLVFPRAVDDVFELGDDDGLDTGDAEMDG